jgi:DNA polymerase-3 subunit alpha
MNDPSGSSSTPTSSTSRAPTRWRGSSRTRRMWLSGTMQFPERCNLNWTRLKIRFRLSCPEGETLDSYFERICREGMEKRLATSIEHLRASGTLKKTIPEYQERLEPRDRHHQADEVSRLLPDCVGLHPLRAEQGIPVGPGRGSAAGSLVAYCMGITDIDPMQNELLFERFLNPERVSMPDIDVDFCMNRRGEVIEYVTGSTGASRWRRSSPSNAGGEGRDQGRTGACWTCRTARSTASPR